MLCDENRTKVLCGDYSCKVCCYRYADTRRDLKNVLPNIVEENLDAFFDKLEMDTREKGAPECLVIGLKAKLEGELTYFANTNVMGEYEWKTFPAPIAQIPNAVLKLNLETM